MRKGAGNIVTLICVAFEGKVPFANFGNLGAKCRLLIRVKLGQKEVVEC